MDDKQSGLMIRVASIVSWAFAVICAVILVTVLSSALSKGEAGNMLPLFIVFTIFSGLYAVIGWGLGKFLKWPAILALIITGLNFIFNLLNIAANPSAVIGVIISLAVIILIALGWKALK